MVRRKFTDEQLRALVVEGLSSRAMAERLGCSLDTVSEHRRLLGIPASRSRVDGAELRRLVDAGFSSAELCAQLGVSLGSLYMHLRKLGINPRMRTRAHREQQVVTCLQAHGPMPMSALVAATGFPLEYCRLVARRVDAMRTVRFKVGTHGGIKYKANTLFDGLVGASCEMLVYLAGDERLVPYVAQHLMPMTSQGVVAATRRHLKRLFGRALSRRMIEATGYVYRYIDQVVSD